MEIIEDNTEKVIYRQSKIVDDILDKTFTHTYNCKCGTSFKVNALDIQFNWILFDYKDFYIRCPHCGEYHYIQSDVEWPSADDTFKDIKFMLTRRLIDMQKELKVQAKDLKKEQKQREKAYKKEQKKVKKC